jgi:hypothetical protein
MTPTRRSWCPTRIRTPRARNGSARVTPGRCLISWSTATDAGSTRVTVTSWRCARCHCDSMTWSMASFMKLPRTKTATAVAIPSTDSIALTGWRSNCRRIMRPAGENNHCSPNRSTTVGRNAAGGSGRIASAGGSRTAARTAISVPATHAPPRKSSASATTAGSRVKSKTGKRKNRVYISVSPRPSQAPKTVPKTTPTSTMTSTILR